MATDTVKVDTTPTATNIPEPRPIRTLDAPAVVDNSMNGVSDKILADGSKGEDDAPAAEAKAESAAANNEPVTDVQKKMKRAERFGVPVQLSEKDKRNSRAERFGSAVSTNETDAVNKAEEQKRKARAERFGITAESVSDSDAKKKARLEKFMAPSKVDSVEDDKRKARALRFSQPSAGAVSNLAVEGNLEQKAAVAGNAGGTA